MNTKENETPPSEPIISTVAPSPAPQDPGRTSDGESLPAIGTDSAIDRATSIAVAKHDESAPAPKRGRGRPKGSTKSKNPFASDPVDETEPPPLVPQNSLAPNDPPPAVTAAPVLSKETIAVFAEACIEGFDELTTGLASLFVARTTGNKELVNACLERCKMGKQAKNLLNTGGKMLIEKHQEKMQMAPEWIVGIGLALAIGQKGMQVKAIISTHNPKQ